MKIVATMSLPAVDHPNVDRQNAAHSRQFRGSTQNNVDHTKLLGNHPKMNIFRSRFLQTSSWVVIFPGCPNLWGLKGRPPQKIQKFCYQKLPNDHVWHAKYCIVIFLLGGGLRGPPLPSCGRQGYMVPSSPSSHIKSALFWLPSISLILQNFVFHSFWFMLSSYENCSFFFLAVLFLPIILPFSLPSSFLVGQ